jgi:hypothetical protein
MSHNDPQKGRSKAHQAHHALANSLGVIVSVENKGLLGYIPKLILRPNFKSKLGHRQSWLASM